MQIGFCSLWEIKIDDNVHSLNVDTSGQQVRADQVTDFALSKFVKHLVSGQLGHFCVGVVTRVAQFGDFLGQQFDSVGGVTENDRLVDLQFAEKSVEAVQFLLFFNESVELRDTSQSQLIHQVDLIRLGQVFVHKRLDGIGKSGGEQKGLSALGKEGKNLCNDVSELSQQHLVCLIHDKKWTLAQVGNISGNQVQHTARGTHKHMHGLVQSQNVILQVGTTRGDHALNT